MISMKTMSAMKIHARRLLCGMLLLGLLAGAAAALAEDGGYAYVENPDPADRLHLREQPSVSARSLGRYYTGTPVQILGEEGEFSCVRVGVSSPQGSAEGYMMTKFLARGYQPPRSHEQWGSAVSLPDSDGVRLLAAQDGESLQTLQSMRQLQILGDIGEDWLHVMLYAEERSGFVRREEIMRTPRVMNEYGHTTMIENGEGSRRVNLRTEPRQDARSIGEYWSGCIVELYTDETMNPDWAYVTLIGGEMGADNPQAGYVQRRFIAGDEMPQVARGVVPYRFIAGAQGQETLRMRPSEASEARGLLQNGAVVVEHGRAGGWSEISYCGYLRGYVPTASLEDAGQQVTSWGEYMPLRVGLGVIEPAQGGTTTAWRSCQTEGEPALESAETLAAGASVQVLAVTEDFAQVYFGYSRCMFVPRGDVRLVETPALSGRVSAGIVYGAGTFVGGEDLPADLYTLKPQQVGDATATILNPQGGVHREYAVSGDEMHYISFYLPDGYSVRVQNGQLCSLQKLWMWYEGGKYTGGHTRVISGTNIDPVQIFMKLPEGKEEGWYRVSNILEETAAEPSERIYIAPGEDHTIDVGFGMFVEVDGVEMWVNG